MEKKTPLYDSHVKQGGKIVPFGGFLLPVQYKTGIIAEHTAVRTKAGLFDVSHMGEFFITGKDAMENVNYIITNDVSDMKPGDVRYTTMCHESGGIVDDFLVYCMSPEKYLLVVNAANIDKDFQHIKPLIFGDAALTDRSEKIGQLALQGPRSNEILLKLCEKDDIPEKYYTFTERMKVAGKDCLVSRTGYTGEDGFEIYCKAEDTPYLWERVLLAGEEFGILPAGLGCRDTLRMEAGMPLYGHEMTDDIDPYTAGLFFCVKLKKERFVGKEALIEKKEHRTMKRVGLKLIDRGIAREHCQIFHDGKEVGFVSSGTHSPTLGYPVAMAYVPKELAELGQVLELSIRNKMVKAEVIALPFYKREQ